MWQSVRFYSLVIGGLLMLAAAPFAVFRSPLWLILLVPVLTVWSVWLLKVYWDWVRSLGQ
jgi:hypothetical protein